LGGELIQAGWVVFYGGWGYGKVETAPGRFAGAMCCRDFGSALA
jgi:hypothetical protein